MSRCLREPRRPAEAQKREPPAATMTAAGRLLVAAARAGTRNGSTAVPAARSGLFAAPTHARPVPPLPVLRTALMHRCTAPNPPLAPWSDLLCKSQIRAFFGGAAARAPKEPASSPKREPKSDKAASASEEEDEEVPRTSKIYFKGKTYLAPDLTVLRNSFPAESRKLKRSNKAIASSDSEAETSPKITSEPASSTTPEKENNTENGSKKRKKQRQVEAEDDRDGRRSPGRLSAADAILDEALDSMGSTSVDRPSKGKKVAAMKSKSGAASAADADGDQSMEEADKSPAKRARSRSRSKTPEAAAEELPAVPSPRKRSPSPAKKTASTSTKPKNAFESMMGASKKQKGKGPAVEASASKAEKDNDADEDAAEDPGEEEDKLAAAAAKQALKSLGKESADWKKGEKVPYAALCKMFERNEATTKRLEKIDITRSFFQSVIQLSPESLLETVYLCLNKIAPDYDGLELGVGATILMKAVAGATGRSVPAIKMSLEEIGDLGEVAQQSREKQPTMFKPKPLTVPHVFKTLKEIASFSGQKSQEKKVEKIQGMIAACNGAEAKFLIRSLEGKLRIGLAEKTVLIALGHAAVLARPENKKLSGEKLITKLAEAAEIIRAVFTEMPSYDRIVPVLIEQGIEELPNQCHLTPGIPLKPMLAHPTKSITEVLDRFEGIHFTCEWKYDGERAQVHRLEDGKVHIYSRNSENLTPKYPEVLERLHNAAKPNVASYVLDCECVAWDREKKQIRPFQALSTRKRKDVNIADIEIQVCLFAFDILYLNGEPLIREPFQRRRELLHENFVPVEGEFAFAQHDDAQTVEEIQRCLDESIAGGCEGLMVKTLDKEASYEPSKRSRNWLKVKKDYLSNGVGDSLDLVVIGGYYGRGKRSGGYGGFLLACYDAENEQYQTICKVWSIF